MMQAQVASQLERLYQRIEFNDDFELDIIAPHTWLAEWLARFELEQRLGSHAGFEPLELSLPPDHDVLEPAQRFVEALKGEGSRVLLVHVRDDGGDPRRWQPFFRRLNEIRNAIVREWRGNLVLLLAASLVTEFAGEAPDMWSIGAVMVIGTHGREQLEAQMFDHVPALLALTRMPVEEAQVLVGAVDPRWAQTLSASPVTRGRQTFELLLQFDRCMLERFDVRPDVLPISFGMKHWTRGGGGVFYAFNRSSVSHTIHKSEISTLRDGSRLLTRIQEDAKFEFRALYINDVVVPWSPAVTRARQCFDFVLFESSQWGWTVWRGDTRYAPALQIATRLLPFVEIQIAATGRSAGLVALRVRSEYELESPQLWLPHIDPAELGTFSLYPPAPESE